MQVRERRAVARRQAVRGARRDGARLVTLLAFLCVVPAPRPPSDIGTRTGGVATRLDEIPAQRDGPAYEEARAPRLDVPNDRPLAGVALPSAPYRHAVAHADDQISFSPGARASVPFRPRADGVNHVDSLSPLPLPAGPEAGRQLRDPADLGSSPVDQSIGPAIAARTVSASGAGGDPEAGATAALAPTGRPREVFGFLPYWQLTGATVLDWATLSTVAYFSVGCTSSGGLLTRDADGSVSTGWAGWTSARMTSVINRAHAHGTRVVLTITCFAWSGPGAYTQASLLGNPAARSTFARQVAAAVRDRGADGVNLDFEPILPGYADEFTALVRAVRLELDAVAPGYQLTFDAMATVGDQPIAEATAPGGADAVVIMGYDYRTWRASVAGSISPLRGPGYDLTDTVDAFIAETPASKIILAVPYYGRAWSTETNRLHASTRQPARFGSAAEPYYDQAVALARVHGRRYDRVEESPWTAYRRKACTPRHGCRTTWRQLYFDDAASLKLRYALVNRTGLRGVGIWALGFDGARPELRAALAASFPEIGTPPAANPSPTASDEQILVRWRSWEPGTIRHYDVQVSVDGAPFVAWLSDTSLTSSTMVSAGDRTYAFRVRATDVRGTVSAWRSIPFIDGRVPGALAPGGFGRVVVDGLRLRSSPSLSGGIRRYLAAGTSLLVKGRPVRRDGYTWYRVSGPVHPWDHPDSIHAAGWVAAYGRGWTHLVPRQPLAPRATTRG